MRNIEKMLYHGSAYTLLLLTVYYIFSSIVSENAAVSVTRFLLIALFGFIVAACELINAMTEIKAWLRRLIHYAVLLVAFSIIFISGGFIDFRGPETVVAVILVFSAFYFVLFTLIVLIRKSVSKADDKLEKISNEKSKKKASDKEKNKYKPRFK